MTRTPRPIVLLSSGGKDSLYMLETLRRDPAWQIEALITTVNETNNRVAMHGTPAALLRAQADSLGLPLQVIGLPEGCDNREYEGRLSKGLSAFQRAGIEYVACGDLFLEDIRQWRERSFESMGWRPVFAIWGTPTTELVSDLIGQAWQVAITCVDTRRVPESLLGRFLDESLVDDLPRGVDPCGENGEFHSFVCRAPGFAFPVDVRFGRRVRVHEHFVMIDLESV